MKIENETRTASLKKKNLNERERFNSRQFFKRLNPGAAGFQILTKLTKVNC